MTPRRIAYLPPLLRPAGAERQMLLLAERLPKDRFRVDFLAMSGAGPYDERARAAGAGLTYLGTPPRAGASVPERLAGRAAKTARYLRAARAGRYDVIDAWLYPVDVMAVLARVVTRTPVVVTGRYNLRDFSPPMSRPERWLNDQANRMVDAVVANSDAVAEDTRRHESIDERKLRVIRNGVEPIAPLTAAEIAAGRRGLGVGDDEILFGCVANLHPVKRHDLLIDAFAVLRRDGLPVRLVMLGGGPLLPDLQRRIDDAACRTWHGSSAASRTRSRCWACSTSWSRPLGARASRTPCSRPRPPLVRSSRPRPGARRDRRRTARPGCWCPWMTRMRSSGRCAGSPPTPACGTGWDRRAPAHRHGVHHGPLRRRVCGALRRAHRREAWPSLRLSRQRGAEANHGSPRGRSRPTARGPTRARSARRRPAPAQRAGQPGPGRR